MIFNKIKTIFGKEEQPFFERLKSGLGKTKHNLVSRIDNLLGRSEKISPELLKNLEEILITSDIGITTTKKLLNNLETKIKNPSDTSLIKDILKNEIISVLNIQDTLHAPKGPLRGFTLHTPYVIMVVGVNGVGKTTTIAKIASKYIALNKKVLLAAADTFRAAAIEQLEIWGTRVGAKVIKHKEGADPSAVAFDALSFAKKENYDVVIVDTAGRLHTKVNLMDELKKVKRVLAKVMANAPHEILLILDATCGQNAINQAKQFKSAVDITDIALTKLDGTAKGGVIIGIIDELKIPVKYIGVGEQIDDLQEFNPETFTNALFS